MANRVPLRLSLGTIHVLSRRDLIRNKRASGREKDLADLIALTDRRRRDRRR